MKKKKKKRKTKRQNTVAEDTRSRARITSLHGPIGVRKEARRDNNEEKIRHTRSFKAANKSTNATFFSPFLKNNNNFSLKIKRKLRIFISNQYYPAKVDADNEDDVVSQWELRIEGKLVEDVSGDVNG